MDGDLREASPTPWILNAAKIKNFIPCPYYLHTVYMFVVVVVVVVVWSVCLLISS